MIGPDAPTSRGHEGNEMIKSYIVMDLELNCSNNRFVSERNGVRLTNEIVEIGAVKLDSSLNEIDRYCRFVKPAAYNKMNGHVTELTEITTDMIQSGLPFPEAAAEFLEWCGEDSAFVTWSENDINMLEDNLLYHGLSIEGLPGCFDIQPMFGDLIMDEDRSFALSYALWKLDIKPEPSHDALNDAVNTAAVFRVLCPEGDTAELEYYAI